MITFLDENDVEYGALATIKATNAVNGERSLTGTIVSGDYVLSNIERGWRLRFDDEYYVVTYAKPIDEGRDVQVEFDAVHQFFWDFDKSSVYDQLADGSHTFIAYLDFIFKSSGYSYTVDTALNVHAFEKQSFGFKKRLTLFNDIITSTGVEFQVNGKVVRILEKVGTDLSTVVRKNFNMNELTIEKNIGDFVTYQKGFGAYFDEEDHSKGRLEVEYTSPLASVYGRLEAEPFVDERYSQSSSLLAALKENVDNSYSISVSLDMEDLTRAGYKYKQPIAGDYIMAINETLGFKEKIRIVSFTSEYDVAGQLIKHTVTCNDIGSVKKLSAGYNLTKKQAASASDTASNAFSIANKALISADGKNTNYYGDSFPVDNPKGTLKKGDLLFLTVGDTVKQYYWNGADWVINPVVSDVEAFKEHIAEELKDVPNREEFENKISEEIANSKAEIETKIETAKTQAESNAKEYADTINQETTKVAELANAAAGEIKADLVNVKNNLTSTSLVANNAQAAVDAAKRDLAAVNTKVDSAKAELTQAKQQLTTVSDDLSKAKTDFQNAVSAVDTKATNLQSDLSQAKQDLASQAQQLQTQASAQSELTKRVTTVETTANGTKTTVNELTKTVAQNGKDITSVTNRTKTVEDDLANTKTTLTQVQTTANSASQKTATLETGLDGLSAKFNSLSVGNKNYLPASRVVNRGCSNFNYSNTTKSWTMTAPASSSLFGNGITFNTKDLNILLNGGETLFFGLMIKANKACSFNYDVNNALSGTTSNDNDNDDRSKRAHSPSNKSILANVWTKVWFSYTAKANVAITENNSKFGIVNNTEPVTIEIKDVMVAKSNVPVDYQAPDADLEQKIAEYKQTADQNYASLQTTVQNLDGTVQHNKTVADQTAQGFTTRIESLETYKDGESTRANQYFESAKTETARQLTAERTAIAKDYVAKSTYTSDVTGIRNDLSATTTTANTIKTNLANYQASNDKVVASLKSSLQTTDGNVSNLQTKVEAVPGQITSAVSAVEGKIPTTVGARNYIRNYGLTATGWGNTNAAWKIEIIPDSTAKSGQYLKATCTTASTSGGGFHKKLFDFSDGRFFGKQMTWSMDVKLSKAKSVKIGPEWGYAYLDTNATTEWKRYSKTFTVATTTEYSNWIFYTNDKNWNVGDIVYIRDVQLEDGSIATSPVPAIEDTESDITKLNTTLTQTADGLKQLSTQVTSQGNTISTHTTQISALNTGLSAKVSQTDFNTLSGRVTTAENNITAKANELSSKITTVEGKIPTTAGGRNYALKTGDSKSSTAGDKLYDLSSAFDNIADDATLIIEFDWSVTAPTSTSKFRINRVITYSDGTAEQWNDTIVADGVYTDVSSSSGSGRYSGTFTKVPYNGKTVSERYLYLNQSTANGTITISNLSVRVGSLKSDWQPAPEDTASQISSLSSQIKQTADGMTLLATKTELNSAKSDLQSGITTATSKADNAQVTANSNAQTISTHTTQISALNIGLQAKVSQSDFNTLSGRVTTAENNITAKANELSSKITSVDGKIPTTVGGRNYALKTGDFKSSTGGKLYDLSSAFDDIASGAPLIVEFDWSVTAPTSTSKFRINRVITYSDGTPNQWNNVIYKDGVSSDIITSSGSGHYSGTFNNFTYNGKTVSSRYLNLNQSTDSGTVTISNLSIRVGSLKSDWQPAPEDYDSKLAGVEGKIPTSASQRNLVQGTSVAWSPFVNITTNNNWRYYLATVNYGDKTGIYAGTTINLFVYLSADEIVLDSSINPQFFIQGEIIDKNGNATWTNWDKYHPFSGKWSTNLVSGNNYRIVKLSAKVSNESYSNINGFKIEVRINGVRTGKFHHRALMVTTGDVFPDSWSPAPEDAFTQISSVSSEFKQTTDAIKASVQSLDNNTVKSSSLTINADGIVMKAGKSTTDVANAIGSYFAVNQNAINLFSDKINVKGNMIVNGAITSDKIASKSINTAHLNGKIITADVISSNAVTADAIKAGAVTTDKMSANSINGDRITAGTLDAAKIKAGSITASQIASGTITSNQIKAGSISTANIAAGAITGDKIAAGAIDANKIAANAITANMIRGGQLKSTNGATSFDLNAGTLTFNNDYGYIQRVASDKVFEITTVLGKNAESQDFLTSDFTIRKSDFSRQAGAKFTLYNATADKPTARATIHADELVLFDSQNTTLLSILAKGSLSNFNFQGWGDIPVAQLPSCGLMVKDIGIGGYTKSLQKIVEELCRKTGVIWI